MDKLKIGLAGLGRIGKIHLENLSRYFPEAEMMAVMDVSEETAAIAAKYQVQHFYDNFGEMLTKHRLDAVVICSPTDTHADYVEMAATTGLDIFCEKPLDLSLERVKAVLKTVDEHQVKLMLGFNRRFDPEFKKIHDLVQQEAVGDPQIIKITSRDPGPPPVSYIKVSGGLFLDMSIHDFDMARYISGKKVVEVFAAGAVKVDEAIGAAGDIDTALITLIFEDQSMAVIDNSRKAAYGYDQRLEVFGSKGMVQAENKFQSNHKLLTANGLTGDLPLYFFLERYEESYRLEMKAFLDALASGETIPGGGLDGLLAMEIGLAARKSMEENRAVKISEIGIQPKMKDHECI
ncbi:MAG: inositol 2-dehydrogenase [Bacteroidales bacterium]|nr:inositol 2-dehydrogenase [Bacteroidales bacterium]